MSFASLHFLIFFPIAVALYFATPGKWRWATLLALSYYFYGSWRVEYLFLLMAGTLIDYGCALGMAASRTLGRRRAFFAISLSLNLGVLFFFKYYSFFSETLRTLLAPFGVAPGPSSFHPLLPVGISFFTFQILAYSIDVYKGRCPAERHLGKFALYVAFFPQLVAGPIERPQALLPQLDQVKKFDGHRVISGLTRMAWGFFLKLVIADRVAVVVSDVYNNPNGQTAASIILATYLFAFQIYADFAGYTDIAIGSARVMGFDLMENFRRPYLATSITDFWRRWHISMSTWFHDYVFQPLGGARKGRARAVANIMIVFVLSGLWHGAAWTYVVSGLLFAAFFLFGHLTRRARNGLWDQAIQQCAALSPTVGHALRAFRPWLARVIVFNLVCCVFIFFRANSVSDAAGFLKTVIQGAGGYTGYMPTIGAYELMVALGALLVLGGHHMIERTTRVDDLLTAQPRWVRWGAFYGIATTTILFGNFGTQPFIYFQF
jgi:alginate O-acetyltransferase complex protein AlgI